MSSQCCPIYFYVQIFLLSPTRCSIKTVGCLWLLLVWNVKAVLIFDECIITLYLCLRDGLFTQLRLDGTSYCEFVEDFLTKWIHHLVSVTLLSVEYRRSSSLGFINGHDATMCLVGHVLALNRCFSIEMGDRVRIQFLVLDTYSGM